MNPECNPADSLAVSTKAYKPPLIGTYLLLRLLMFVCRKLRRRPNGALEIASMGVLTLAVCTVVGGFGMQDDGPEPLFYRNYPGTPLLTARG